MEPTVIAIDPYLIAFVKENFITLTVVLATLKVVARETSWTGDDKIYTLLATAFSTIRPKRKNGNGKPPPE